MIKSMDKETALKAFRDYTSMYDETDVRNTLKISHTFRVADIAEQIAKSLDLTDVEVSFAWFLGLVHDIGRFEQLKRYDTFVDIKSVDHAELGADILFKDGLISKFPCEDLHPRWRSITELSVRLHNKLNIPDDLDEESKMFVRILRDADKCDIFRVLTEPPYDERNNKISSEARPARDSIMVCVREHRCVPRVGERTDFENLISQCCMAFELYYPKARQITASQGYLKKLLDTPIVDEQAQIQFKLLNTEMNRILK